MKLNEAMKFLVRMMRAKQLKFDELEGAVSGYKAGHALKLQLKARFNGNVPHDEDYQSEFINAS